MERIFIIGYMGSGKTTVGKLLARSLSLEFIDLDAYIENKYRKTISALFAGKGEEEFRKIESQALHEVAQFEDVVISTGGGAPCYLDNMALMNQAGTTVYIKADPEELAARLAGIKNRASSDLREIQRRACSVYYGTFGAKRALLQQCKNCLSYRPHDYKKDIHLTVLGIEELLKKRKEK